MGRRSLPGCSLWFACTALLCTRALRVDATDVHGHISYYANQEPVAAVTVRCTLPTPPSVVTDAGGDFTVPNGADAASNLIPEKSGDVGRAVSALDASYALQAAIGARHLSPEQILACDVTGNGSVSALDASLILQHTLGAPGRFPVAEHCGGDWLFVPQGAAVQPPQITPDSCQLGAIHLDPTTATAAPSEFVGLVIGDCTGNWVPSVPTAPPTATATRTRTAPPTHTPTPVRTATFTATATFSATPLPTSTPTTAAPQRPLGTVTLLSGPVSCGGQSCYRVRVSCAGLMYTAQALLKVGAPTASPPRGTILFATGYTGTFYWETLSSFAAGVLSDLRAAGFQTVQLEWASTWFQAANSSEGHAALACRPASVARWVYDTLHPHGPTTAFCAAGHSNGAAQVAYTLTHYGLGSILSAVELDGGPNFADLEQGCLQDNAAQRALWYPPSDAAVVDWGFGVSSSGSGPCARHDPLYRQAFRDASLGLGNWSFVYPQTMVSFLFGAQDATATAAHGRYYHQRLTQAGSPLVTLASVANTGHTTVSTYQGATLVRDTLLNECRPR